MIVLLLRVEVFWGFIFDEHMLSGFKEYKNG